VGNKSFLAHVFKLKRKCITSTLARDLKSKILNENHLVTAHTSKNMIRRTWLDVSFSSHVKKVIRAIWLAFRYLDQLVNENLFRAFSVDKSQYLCNKNIFVWKTLRFWRIILKKIQTNYIYTQWDRCHMFTCLVEFNELSFKSTHHTLLQQMMPSIGIKLAEG